MNTLRFFAALALAVSLGRAPALSGQDPFPIDEPRHNVMVRAVLVTPDWQAYDSVGGGWPSAVPEKESQVLKFFEVAIWEDRRSVHFYEFDNDFDDSAEIAHREAYVVMKMDGMPGPNTPERSRFLRDAFAKFTSYLTERYPDSGHHLMYNGHGGPGGRLFEAQVTYSDASSLLAHWAGKLGRRLGVVDMGGPCNKGSFSDLENFCQHSRYYVASDLPNGGFTMDDWTSEKFWETNPEAQYHRLFKENASLEEVLSERIDLRRRLYEYSRANMTTSEIRQGNYLYSCSAFTTFAVAFWKFVREQGGRYVGSEDLYDYMVEYGADSSLFARFEDVFVRRADNRDFFDWGPGAHGMLVPSRLPLAARLVAPATAETYAPVAFDGSGSLGSRSYSWDFGDGYGIEHPNANSTPVHYYAKPGSYEVRLEVARGGDCGEQFCEFDTATAVVEVEAGAPPVARFELIADCGEDLCIVGSGVEVELRDLSTGTVAERRWDFGDGVTSRAPAPRHSWTSPGFYRVELVVSGLGTESTASRDILVRASDPAGTCEPNGKTLCLQDSRYAVSVDWWSGDGGRGKGTVVHAGTNEVGLFRFFDTDNWEILIKVLDGCAVNGHVWVFGASTTDVGYTIRVTDTVPGHAKEYRNEPGAPAAAMTDTKAFSGGCRQQR
ncbi:MAG: PKD domain-containing protein [Acidobacteria bacterium]|nr:PKD domain-containing protein [Acidobacteriota bacterium]